MQRGTRPLRYLLLGTMLAVMASGAAAAQDFPSKPVKIIVPYAAGGGADIVARMLAQKLQDKWGSAVVVENRAGAGGNLGAEAVFTAEPDGHTLLFTAQGPLVVNQSLYGKLAYDPDAFTAVSLAVTAYSVLLAHPKLPAENLRDLIAFAKANPDRLNYASQGIGTAAHLTAELFKAMAGIQIVHVPYKGSGPALNDLVAGHVSMMFGELAAAHSYVASGLLRPLAVSSAQRNSALPDVPTVSEVLPGFVVTSWWAMVAPPGTPTTIADKLSGAIAEVLRQTDVAARLADMSMVAAGSSPAQLSAFMREERERWGQVIRTAGARAE